MEKTGRIKARPGAKSTDVAQVRLPEGHPTCEKLIEKGQRDRQDVGHFPYRCGRPAAIVEVSGLSFSARATLCQIHLRAAKKEGFTYRFITPPLWKVEI